MNVPKQLRYTREHAWISVDSSTEAAASSGAPCLADGFASTVAVGSAGTVARVGSIARVGVTQVVADTLSDIVWLRLPEVGGIITEGETCGELGSVRAGFDLLAPVTGQVVAANPEVLTSPSAVGSNAYTAWLYMVAVTGDPADLLTATEYDAYAAN
jgi:glycine cleavage system H protein